MKKYKLLLFDLDGTISNPKVGITKSVQYALEKMGIEAPPNNELECFIGPPLSCSFKKKYQMNEQDTQKAIQFYRERFKEQGLFENELYENIEGLLKNLTDHGLILVIATSKPTVFAEEIVTYFKIDYLFDAIVGSNLDGTRSAKAEVIEHILQQYNHYHLDECVMIGDTTFDIIGAKDNSIDSIAVTYGFDSYKRLKAENPTYIVEKITELQKILL